MSYILAPFSKFKRTHLFISVCVHTLVCLGEYVEVRGQLAEISSLSNIWIPGIQTQPSSGLVAEHLHPLCHLAGPKVFVLSLNDKYLLICMQFQRMQRWRNDQFTLTSTSITSSISHFF